MADGNIVGKDSNAGKFKIEKLDDAVAAMFAEKLGSVNTPVEIIGYISTTNKINAQVFNELNIYLRSELGPEYSFYPAHPHDTLPDALKKKMSQFRDNSPCLYNIIYKSA